LKNKNINPSLYDNSAIKIATRHHYTEITKMLLNDPRVDPSVDDNFAILYTSNPEIIKMLLTHPKVDTSGYKIISNYSDCGYVELVEILLNDPRVNPSVNKNLPLRLAYKQENREIVFLLWNDIRVKNTLQKDHPNIYEELKKQDIQDKISQF
jgi:hypothetical protein